MKRIFSTVFSLYGLILFVAIMMIAFPFILLCLLFGKVKGGNYIYKVCNYWSQIWYFFVGIQHVEIVESPVDTSKQYIFIANHISYLDIPATVLSVRQAYRVLGKQEMVKYPVFGWIYRAAVILVDRSNAAARAKSVRELHAALKRGISIFIFPEGTFNETDKPLKSFYDGAFRLAIQTKTPIKPLIFLDTDHLLNQYNLFSLKSGKNRVVYLPEIAVDQYEIKDVNRLKELAFSQMEAALVKYHTNDKQQSFALDLLKC